MGAQIWWSLKGWTVATGLAALAVACGSGDGKKHVRACDGACPIELCDLETGLCTSNSGGAGGEGPDSQPSAGADSGTDQGGAPSTAGAPTAGAPPDDEPPPPVDEAPSIGDVAAIVTPEDVATGELPFTVADADTPVEDLVVTATLDSDLPLPPEGVLLGGSGGERTVTLTPAQNAFGAAILTLSVSDGSVTVTKEVPVTVTPVNDPPTIEDVPDQGVAEDAVLGPLSFRVSDLETATNDLVVTATSGDTTKVPQSGIALGGEGEDRTLTITPAAQQVGPLTITLEVSDGELTATDSFVLTLGASNDQPTISDIADQTVEPDTSTGALSFTVSDPDGDAPLTVTASSADLTVVPASNITLGGTDGLRTISVLPGAKQGGSSLITVTVSDGKGGTASDTFTLSARVKLASAVVGSGSVSAVGTGNAAGCTGTACTALPGAGTVTFTATPGVGAMFSGWSEGCTGTGKGVLNAIPTAGVICTATFKNLWARMFYTPNVAQHAIITPEGVVETGKVLHYLGREEVGEDDTVAVWIADPVSGQVQANSAFEVYEQDGSALYPVELMADPASAEGAVVLSEGAGNSSALMWFDSTNTLTRALDYGAVGYSRAPRTGMRNAAKGITFLETSFNFASTVALPTVAQLVRVDGTGSPLGATVFRENVAACASAPVIQDLGPFAIAQSTNGTYLVASLVAPLAGTGLRLNLTAFDAAGVALWGRHVESGSNPTATVSPRGVVANGNNFLVTGLMTDGSGTNDGFGLSISSAGVLGWWKAFGADGNAESALRAAARGNDFVVTGVTTLPQGTTKLFALGWTASGLTLGGQYYGGGGSEAGMIIAPAAFGGFNLFGSTSGSFSNAVVSTWGLRIDKDLKINLQAGSMTAYAPTLKDVTPAITATCVDAQSTGTFLPTSAVLNASATPIAMGGTFQAVP